MKKDERVAYSHAWYMLNRERILAKQNTPQYRERVRLYAERIKNTVFTAYGNKCSCCGEDCVKLLALDHVNNDGNKERYRNGRRIKSTGMYLKVIKENFPPKYQLLCFSCNWGKHVNNGVCPHKEV